ncbi:MAG: hypothetical protein JWM89_3434 [Acidimicrobiales bacterium]|nr:hypothetical protein [Acidimicrobiales bacterium]
MRGGGYSMARRNELARARGFSSYAQQRKYGSTVANRDALAALPPDAAAARERALDALAVARREQIPLADAARREGIGVDAIAWWSEGATERRGTKTWASTGDRLLRPMYVYSAGQVIPVDVRGSRVASSIGRYHSAVHHYLSTGDASRLEKFRGVKVGGIELEADVDVIDELARQGSFDFESIYRMVQ